jgi:hypothetical protein
VKHHIKQRVKRRQPTPTPKPTLVEIVDLERVIGGGFEDPPVFGERTNHNETLCRRGRTA